MGIQMPLFELYQASMLGRMSALTSKERSQVPEEAIDWTVETTIPDKVLDSVQVPACPPPQKHLRQVLLTGSAGFLGSEILMALVNDKNIAKIYCIAVPVEARDKMRSNEKVVTYSGSLLTPNLGLSASEVAFLQPNVDQIIHAGAQGHCLK